MSNNNVQNEDEKKTGGFMVEMYEWLEAIAFALSIVVITQPNSHDNEPLIKRVIAVEGQTITIDAENDTVTVDGVVLNENYILEEDLERAGDAYEYPLTVPKGKVFVMGDNRNDSFDSRSSGLGMVDEDYIMGKAIFRIYPFERVGGLS